jgi:methionine transaminase
MELKSKLPDTGTSIFATMTQLANKYNAINLSQGFPNFDPPTELIDLVQFYMKKGFNQYAAMSGVLSLRKAIQEKISYCYNSLYDVEDEITITAGATQAIFTAITSFIHNFDEVIIFEPAYDSYSPSIKMSGGIPIPIKLNQTDFSIPWEQVWSKLSTRTRMIIINSPHNPTGSIINQNDIKELTNIVKRYNLIVLSDEVYEHIIFDNNRHFSLSSFPELKERAMVISSFGKTFHTTGWKVGYVVAPREMMIEFRKVHQFNVFAVNTPIQYAYGDFLHNKSVFENLPTFYEGKRDFFREGIRVSGFISKPCNGTYFQLLDYSNISNLDDITFSELLVEKFGIAVIPLSPFYSNSVNDKLVRICFAKTEETLQEGINRLQQVKV